MCVCVGGGMVGGGSKEGKKWPRNNSVHKEHDQ